MDTLHFAAMYGGCACHHAVNLTMQAPPGISGYTERVAAHQPRGSALPQASIAGSAASTMLHQMAACGTRHSLYSELQMNQLQQEEKEMIEGAANILTSLHRANVRVFLFTELQTIIRFSEADPLFYSFIHFLSQQSAIAGVS